MSQPVEAVPTRRPPWWALILWLLVLGVFAGVQIANYGWVYAASDDSYIYLGYVKQALHWPPALFSYNLGEHSVGTTGLLFYYLLIPFCGLTRLLCTGPDLPHAIILGEYVLIGLLWLVVGRRYLCCWRRLAPEHGGWPWVLLLFALLCANPKFLWGFFAGMENPLGALLVIVLFEQLLTHARPWKASLTAALLCATRPELVAVLFALPAFAAVIWWRAGPAGRGALLRGVVEGYAVYAAGLAALFGPVYAIAGQVFPSAWGARVDVELAASPAAMALRLWESIVDDPRWQSSWLIWAYVLLFCGLCLRPLRRSGPVIWLALLLLAYYAARAALGITKFNLYDRYVSYLWPAYALGLAYCAAPAVQGALDWLRGRWGGGAVAAACSAVLAAVAVWPMPRFLDDYTRDVYEMNQIVVAPSQWMQANLPAGTRICMEPAGAIRLFTDHYLVDVVGLTTRHVGHTWRDWADQDEVHSFLAAQNIDYFLDYPGRASWIVHRNPYERVMLWKQDERRNTRGPIGLFDVRNPLRAHVRAITGTPPVAGASLAALCDNRPGDPAQAADRWETAAVPAGVTIELAAPVRVTRVTLLVWGTRSRPGPNGRHSPRELLCEGRVAGQWQPLPIAARAAATEKDERETWTLELQAACEIEALRLNCLATAGPFGAVIYEVTLGNASRAYLWEHVD